jgi:23S rRNA (cytidine1920-2'-O)/16S rRNA (cytidine1409-2'-O)-methyltransferase
MTTATSFILVYLVEQRPVGERFAKTRAAWPLHITLVPWFVLHAGQESALRAALARYAKATLQFSATVGVEEHFGPEHDVPVNVIADQTKLRKLHDGLRQVAAPYAELQDETGDFRAHITHHHTADGPVHRRFPDDKEQIDSVTLVRLLDGEQGKECEIVEHFTLATRTKQRLDLTVVARGLTPTRSQAESWIRLGKVFVNGKAATKPGFLVSKDAIIELKATEQYVSRAGLKLASVAQTLHLDFAGKVMLDVGSSTGGFTDYALQHGAHKVIAVDVGTNQLHPSLHGNPQIELHEQTDIRDMHTLSAAPDIVVIDVSFISLRDILPHVAQLSSKHTQIVAMVKPQFEASASNLKHKGVIKNDRMRRDILKSFEDWVRAHFVIIDKADSSVAGSKGNLERFYLLRKS